MKRRHATQAGMLYGRHSDVFPHPDEGVTVVATADLAAMESRAAELESALRALVEAMPRCTAVIDNHIGARCGKPATRAWGRGGDRYCDNHGSYVGGLARGSPPRHRTIHALANGGAAGRWRRTPRWTTTADIRALTAEVARLRKLFDDAGQGEHNVLALVDYYQDAEIKAGAEVARLREALDSVVHLANGWPIELWGSAKPTAIAETMDMIGKEARAALGRTTK